MFFSILILIICKITKVYRHIIIKRDKLRLFFLYLQYYRIKKQMGEGIIHPTPIYLFYYINQSFSEYVTVVTTLTFLI